MDTQNTKHAVLPAEQLKEITEAYQVEKTMKEAEPLQKRMRDYAARYLKRHPKTKPEKLARIVAKVYNITFK